MSLAVGPRETAVLLIGTLGACATHDISQAAGPHLMCSPGLFLDGYLAEKWNELEVLKMVSP